jgi:hypothetical protein
VGPDVAEYTGEKQVLYLGEGCYVAGRTIVACSIDSLPAGERACAVEPGDNSYIVEMSRVRWRGGERELFYDSNLDAFVDDLNTHRCHKRWYDSLEADPVAFTIRDVRLPTSRHFVPLDELGLTKLPATLAVSRATAREACRRDVKSERFVAPICVTPQGDVRVVRNYLFTAAIDVPATLPCTFEWCWLRGELAPALASVRGTPGERQRCALVEVTTAQLACRSRL